MRFNFDAYEKVFPAEQPPQIPTDSAVDDYTPTAEEAKGKIKVESAVEVEEPKKQPVDNAQPTGSPTNTNNGNSEPKEGTAPTEGKIEP
ncbi:MAG: hypothetical protein J6Q24_02340 [Clostridia bacterium]|nr:hypothetical protein [Clostridia bacterium]